MAATQQPHHFPLAHPMNTPPEQLNGYNTMNTPDTSGSNSQQQSRPDSGRRSISATQPLSGQLPLHTNGSAGGAMPTAVPSQQPPHGQLPGIPAGPGMIPFDASRSPPGSKNLNHVPCKFFRQSACQAGKACPFSHNVDSAQEQAPCKYFAKGNCKFGSKCALMHILPDGRRVNHRPGYNGTNIQFGRMEANYPSQRSGSALHNSLMQAGMAHHQTPNHSFGGPEDFPALPNQPINIDQNISSSLPDSRYGSPRDPDQLNMPSMLTSPRTLGPLDATLPASIDRTDYSHYAKYGPFASSVPSKFGMESPPPSLPTNSRGGNTIQSLYMSAYTDAEISNIDLSRSPRVGGEDTFGDRIMHSSSSKPRKLLSSSYARPENMERMLGDFSRERFGGGDVDGDLEDFVPSSLNELLTPTELRRRMSRTDDDGVASFRRSITTPGTPGDVIGSPPVGSPINGWGPIVTRQKREEEHAPISSIGHVGSPLRNSYQHGENSPNFRAFNRTTSGDISPFPGSPTRGSFGISGLSQQFQRTRLASRSDSYGSGDLPTVSKFGPNGKQMERVASGSHSSNGKAVTSIDEESETQFEMEDEEGPSRQVGGFEGLGGVWRGSGLGLDVTDTNLRYSSNDGKPFR